MASSSKPGRVAVLAGGLSHERDVSLRSGRQVAQALRDTGADVEERDVDAALLVDWAADPPACVVPMLHGETGEDGAMREVLELLDLPYVGAVPASCRVAFDKPVAKAVVAGAGLNTPPAVALPHAMFREVGASAVMAGLLRRLGLPLVVKPTRGGSALGCTVVQSAAALPGAMVSCFAYGGVALVERFVDGTEVALSVIDTGQGAQALPAVEIRPDGGVYDYTARYTAGATEFVVPAELPAEQADACARVALRAHQALGLRDLSRSDLVIDADGAIWFLEVNVAPGMTETSLVPIAARAAGLALGTLFGDLVAAAIARGTDQRHR